MEEGSGLPGGMLQRIPLHQQQQVFSHSQHQQQQRNLLPFAPQSHANATYSYGTSGGGSGAAKQQQTQSSEEELGSDAAKRVSEPQSPSPWQRMKWTDSMVRLLVWVVHSVGDETGAGGDGAEQQQKGKKAATLPSAASAQQKKGKWKSVSRAMMEKGFYVSPQQCEDKFNDLNKRYKRVNELLGKGTACRVVENPSLLDSMDHLPHKAKEEARKLLSSKHLFFREMCAYHNTCGGGGLATVVEKDGHGHDGHLDDDDAVDSEEEDEDYEDDVNSDEENKDGEGIFAAAGGGGAGAKRKAAASLSPAASSPLSLTLSSPSGSTSAPLQQLRIEMVGPQGGQQQRQWLRLRAAELEEQRVVYQQRALQLERQRFKWLRFSTSKEREMERARLRNQRLRLDNESKLLLLQQREIQLLDAAGAAAKSNGNTNTGLNNFTSDHHQN